jgi:hypothetical protein
MVAFSSPYTFANPTGCTAIAVRLAGLVETTSNAAVQFTVTRNNNIVTRVFFRGQQMHANVIVDAATVVGTASTTAADATSTGYPMTSYHATSSTTAFDDFYIEVLTASGSLAIANAVGVWGNHYLSQPVFSQTITT